MANFLGAALAAGSFGLDDLARATGQGLDAPHIATTAVDNLGGEGCSSDTGAKVGAEPGSAGQRLAADDAVSPAPAGRILQKREMPTTGERGAQTDSLISITTAAQAEESDNWMEDGRRSFSLQTLDGSAAKRRISPAASEVDTCVMTTSQWLAALHISPKDAPKYFTPAPPEEAAATTTGGLIADTYLDNYKREETLFEQLDVLGPARSAWREHSSGELSSVRGAAQAGLDSRALEMSMRDTDERLESLAQSTDFVTERARCF
jgi:hypothetical protein